MGSVTSWLCNVSKVTQLVSDQTGIQAPIRLTSNHWHGHLAKATQKSFPKTEITDSEASLCFLFYEISFADLWLIELLCPSPS